jgi:hypothetical protein
VAVSLAKNRKTIKEIPKTLIDTPKPEQYDSPYWKVVPGIREGFPFHPYGPSGKKRPSI